MSTTSAPLAAPGRTWPPPRPRHHQHRRLPHPGCFRILLVHSHVQISLPLGDEKGGPVAISRSPLSTSRHQRAPPPQLAYQVEHVQLTQRVRQCQSLDHGFSLPYSLLESVNGAPFLAGRQSSPSRLSLPVCLAAHVQSSAFSVVRPLPAAPSRT